MFINPSTLLMAAAAFTAALAAPLATPPLATPTGVTKCKTSLTVPAIVAKELADCTSKYGNIEDEKTREWSISDCFHRSATQLAIDKCIVASCTPAELFAPAKAAKAARIRSGANPNLVAPPPVGQDASPMQVHARD